MNILNILHSPKFAGTEKAFLNLTKIICEDRKVFCIIPKNSDTKLELVKLNIKIIESERVRKNLGKFDIFAKYYFRKIISSNNIGLVIVHNGRLLKLLKPVCGKLKIPLLAVNHGTNPIKTALADYAFVLNKNKFRQVIEAGMNRNNVFIIPNFLFLTENTPIEKKDNNSVITIGYMGRFSPEKGLNILIDSIKILQRKYDNFNVIIAGDDLAKSGYIKNINLDEVKDRISFVGWVDNKKEFFSKIDILCLPSINEAFGLVILEAMQFKTAVIATDCEGPIDIIQDGVNGLLAQKNNPDSLEICLEKLLLDRNLRIKIAEEGYNNFINNYTSDIVGAKIKKALNFIAANL